MVKYKPVRINVKRNSDRSKEPARRLEFRVSTLLSQFKDPKNRFYNLPQVKMLQWYKSSGA